MAERLYKHIDKFVRRSKKLDREVKRSPKDFRPFVPGGKTHHYYKGWPKDG